MKLRLILASTLLLLAQQSFAADITWSSSQAATGPVDVVTTYTPVVAKTAYDSGSLTLNGVLFDSFSTADTISIDSLAHGSNGSGTTFDSGNNDYNTFLQNGFIVDTGATGYITLGGLTTGATYFVQIWAGTWDNTYPTSVEAGNVGNLNNGQNTPTYITGLFTADATSQDISYHNSTYASYGVLSGIALSEVSAVPEPATYAMIFGVFALGLVCLARRRGDKYQTASTR